MLTQTRARTQSRWMILRDFPEVLQIENASFPAHPWTEEDFLDVLRQRNCIGHVAKTSSAVVGYVLYEFHRKRFILLKLAVAEGFQRQGVGRMLVERMVSRFIPGRREAVEVTVRESNLDAQLFFRSLGFKAIEVLRDHYARSGEDGYLMRFCLADRIR